VWLNSPADAPEVRERILQLEGIEALRTRQETAREFDLMPERIGELVVTGDKDTVFGELAGDFEISPSAEPRFVPLTRGDAGGFFARGGFAFCSCRGMDSGRIAGGQRAIGRGRPASPA
jgi:hypothetical protein